MSIKSGFSKGDGSTAVLAVLTAHIHTPANSLSTHFSNLESLLENQNFRKCEENKVYIQKISKNNGKQ